MIRYFCYIIAAFIISTNLVWGAVTGSVIVRPSKLEITARPGEIIQREFTITNQSSDNLNLTLRFENLSAPTDPLDGAILAEDSEPIYPLTPYLAALERDFVLPASGQITVPISLQLPKNISPGGFYGAAVFSVTTPPALESNTQLVTRLAPLIFLRVSGEMIEAGSLLDFDLIGRHVRFSNTMPIFYLTYQNTGNIYVNPHGLIEVKNRLTGRQIDLAIDPWFVLPGTTRIREIGVTDPLAGGFPTGWYEANLALNPGYGDTTSVGQANFVIVSPIIFGLIIILLCLILIFVIKRFWKIIFILILFATATHITWAEVASSTNYRLQSDSLNFGGRLSTSTNYGLESTAGELATGTSTSSNYGLNAGYQQMVSSFLSITAPSDVSLSAIAGTGVSSGSVAWTVTTDNSAGYTLAIKAGSSPALVSGGDSFTDYTPSGANPDYSWSVAASLSAFGFSPEGTDTASRYLDNGSSCGVSASNAVNQCWDGFSTTNRTIAQSSAANTPSGVATTVKLQAEIGASKTQPVGNYTSTLTVTATPR
ncbi:MAG: hypothetical protein AAB415_00770 [Patescibacteria group bacterium]